MSGPHNTPIPSPPHPAPTGRNATAPRTIDPDGPRGYDFMAKAMGSFPDIAMLRRFSELSMQNLLHYQAELVDLEVALQRQQEKDKSADDEDRRDYHLDSWVLRDSSKPLAETEGEHGQGQNDASRQWELMMKVREAMKKYQEALVLHRQVMDFSSPHRRSREALDEWMQDTRRGRVYLIGSDRHTWRDTKLSELLTMQPASPDSFPSQVSQHLLHYYHKYIGVHTHGLKRGEGKKQKGKDPEKGAPTTADSNDVWQNTVLYPNENLRLVTKTIKTLVACMLPIVGITILYHVHDPGQRIGIIAALTAVFALTLNFCTSVGIKDIFSSTAAFSAVLVVFVGSTETAPKPTG